METFVCAIAVRIALFYSLLMDKCSNPHRVGNRLVICELPIGHKEPHSGYAEGSGEFLEWGLDE
jgi:hypothetical protein